MGLDLTIRAALEGYPVGWFAPEYKLLGDAWRELRAILEPVTVQADDQQKRIELRTRGTIDAWSFDRNPNAGRSRRYKRVVIDEAAHAANLQESWTRAIRPTLTDFKGDAWFLSSPNGRNYFHDLYQRGRNNEPGWRSWTQTSYDNPLLDPAEIDSAKLDLPPLIFAQEYLAEFLDDVASQLIPTAWLDRCLVAPRVDAPGGVRAIAADLSKGTGRDRFVAMATDGLGLLDLVVSPNIGLAEAATVLHTLSRKWGVSHDRITYDGGGWAGPDLHRYLEAVGIYSAVPYYGAAGAGARWKNKRTLAAWTLRQRLDPERDVIDVEAMPRVPYSIVERKRAEKIAVTPRKQPPFAIPESLVGSHWSDLRQELSELRYTMDGPRIALEKKEDMMARLGRSPDLADTLMMSAAMWGMS